MALAWRVAGGRSPRPDVRVEGRGGGAEEAGWREDRREDLLLAGGSADRPGRVQSLRPHRCVHVSSPYVGCLPRHARTLNLLVVGTLQQPLPPHPHTTTGRTPLTSMLGPLPGGETGGSSHIPKRRAASAAVHAAAAAVAAMDEDEGMEGNPPAIPGVVPVMPFATPLIPGFEHAAEQPQVCVCGLGQGRMAVLSPGFTPARRLTTLGSPPPSSASSPPPPLPTPRFPQAPGRLLMASDIGPGLVGRRAELYWPDNNLWYLIEIRAVNLGSRTASILYTTGEVEELDLDEIVKEGHLSLITPIRAGPGR